MKGANNYPRRTMTHLMRTALVRLFCVFTLSLLVACSGEKSDRQEKKQAKEEKKLAKQEKKREKAEKREQKESDTQGEQVAGSADVSKFAATGCDESLWSHVYNPTRLEKLAGCVTVKGTVEESAADDDGDQHFLLKLDAGQETLVNKTNSKKKNGNLVVEIVCANPVALAKAKSACAGYRNTIALPSVGAHVTATGSYVIDSHNGWAEIHPVSTLTKGSQLK